MRLNEADKQRVQLWITSKCGQMRCVCCGTARWTLFDASSLTIGFDVHTTRFHYHEGIPLISVGCENCGHVVFFSANVLGFKPDEPKHDGPAKAEG